MKSICFLVLLFGVSSAHGDFVGGKDIGPIRVHVNGRVSFGTLSQVSGVCDYFRYQFSFDSTTEGGKSMLSFILSAKALGRPINIWYSPSQSPGTNETNGCTESILAAPSSLGFQD